MRSFSRPAALMGAFSALLLLVHAAVPLSTGDSMLLCSVQPLLYTSMPHPTRTFQSAVARLQNVFATQHSVTEIAAILPGLPRWCHKSTKTALDRAVDRAAAATATGEEQSSTQQSDRDTLTEIGIGAVQVLRSWELPSSTILNVSTAATPVSEHELQRGYHRYLHTTLLVSPSTPLATPRSRNATKLSHQLQRCEVLLLEVVPPTLYFDLYQLSELYAARLRVWQTYPPVRALAYGDIDVEAGAEASPAHALWLHVAERTAQWRTDRDTGSALLHLQLPIHARYQAALNLSCDPSLGAADPCLRPARLEAPRVFLRCPSPRPAPVPDTEALLAGLAPLPPKGETVFQHGTGPQAKTDWLALTSLLQPNQQLGEELTMTVPIASLQNQLMVRFGTFAVSMGAAALLIVLLLMRHFHAKGRRHNAPHRD